MAHWGESVSYDKKSRSSICSWRAIPLSAQLITTGSHVAIGFWGHDRSPKWWFSMTARRPLRRQDQDAARKLKILDGLLLNTFHILLHPRFYALFRHLRIERGPMHSRCSLHVAAWFVLDFWSFNSFHQSQPFKARLHPHCVLHLVAWFDMNRLGFDVTSWPGLAVSDSQWSHALEWMDMIRDLCDPDDWSLDI